MENARRECGKIIGRSIFVRRPDGPGAATVYPEKARSEYICSEVADIRKPAISASAYEVDRGLTHCAKGRPVFNGEDRVVGPVGLLAVAQKGYRSGSIRERRQELRME
jgi:hypothetical protein